MTTLRLYLAGVVIFAVAMMMSLSPVRSSSLSTDNSWKSYKDHAFGVAFEFPATWKLSIIEAGEEHTGENLRLIFIEATKQGELHISIAPNQNKLSLPAYLETMDENYFGPNVNKLANIKVDGHEAAIFGEPANGRTKPMLQAFIWRDSDILQVNFVGYDDSSSPDPFNHFLETLVITSTDTRTQSRTRYHFAFPQMSLIANVLRQNITDNNGSNPPASALRCGNASLYLPTSGTLVVPWNCIDAGICPSYKSSYTGYLGSPHRALDIFGNGDIGTVPVYAPYNGRSYKTGSAAVYIVFDEPYPTNSAGRTIRSAYLTHMARSVIDEGGYKDYRLGPTNQAVIGGVTQIGWQGTYYNDSRVNMHLHISLVTNVTGYEIDFNQTVDPTEFFGAKHMAYHSGYASYTVDKNICIEQPQDDAPDPEPHVGHFPDVPPTNTFYNYIEALYNIEAVSGYSDGNFRPDDELTRGAATKLIILSIGQYRSYSDSVSPFPDVPPGHPFYEYIRRANELGIVSGYSNGEFLPDNPVSRAEYAKMVSVAIGTGTYECEPIFPDVPCGHLFYNYIEHLAEIGAVSGYSDGLYYPDVHITRGQASKVVVLSIPHLVTLLPPFPDVLPDNSFFSYIKNLAERGIISGYSDGYFYADSRVTRGQISQMVTLAMGHSPHPIHYFTFTPTFLDVPYESTFYAYVEFLAERSIVSGYSDGMFRPDDFMTRGQIAKVITLALEEQGITCRYDVPVSFSDVHGSNLFYRYIQCLEELGITNGYSDGTYRPDNNITRGEAAKFVSIGLVQITPSISQERANEENNAFATSPTYTPNAAEGENMLVLPSGDQDYVKLDLSQLALRAGVDPAGSYRIQAVTAGSNANICMQIVDSNDSVIAESYGAAVTGGPTIYWSPPQSPVQYAVKLWNVDGYVLNGVHTFLIVEPVPTLDNSIFLPTVQRQSSNITEYMVAQSTLLGGCNAVLPATPVAPGGVQAEALSSSAIRLVWQDNSNSETEFVIYDEKGEVARVAADTTEFIRDNLPMDTWKCHYIRAFNTMGGSEATDWACNYTTYSYFDGFSDLDSGWFDNSDSFRYVDDEYQIRLDVGNAASGVIYPYVGSMNYIVEADARLYSGSPIRYGLVFDLLDWDHYYVFSVNPTDQTYKLEHRNGSSWTTITSGTSSGIFSGGTSNHLKAVKVGGLVALTINNTFLGTFSGGGVYTGDLWTGLYIKSGNDVPVTARYDNFYIRELPSYSSHRQDESYVSHKRSKAKHPQEFVLERIE